MQKVYNVPMPTHLVKWVSKSFFEGQSAPYRIVENSPIGRLVMSLLNDNRNKEVAEIEFADVLSIELSDTLAKRSSIIKLAFLRLALEELFRHDLIKCVLSQMEFQVGRSKSVKSFLKMYSITETEYTYEAAYQVVKRDNKLRHSSYEKKPITKASPLEL